MPKTKISEYSTTNTDNSDIESINIAEGCAPSGINNAIRELMVHLKEFQTGASGDPLTVAGTFVASGGATLSGTNTFSGSTVMAASAGTSASPSIYFSGDTNTGVFSPAADTIAAATGGAERLRIDSSGNVGIGTSNPAYKLQITESDTSASSSELQRWTTASGGALGIVVSDKSVANPSWYLRSGNSESISFSIGSITDADTKMRITSAGEVLVGGTTAISNAAGITIQNLDSNAILCLFRNDTSISSGNTLGFIGFYGNDTTSNTPTNLAYIQAVASGTHAAGDNPTDLVFGTTPDNSATVAEVVRFTQAGNVGIGTSSPSALLHVNGTAKFSDAGIKTFSLTGGAATYTKTLTIAGLSDGVAKVAIGLVVSGSTTSLAAEYLIGGVMSATNNQKTLAVINATVAGSVTIAAPAKTAGGFTVAITLSGGTGSSLTVIGFGSGVENMTATFA